MLKLVSIEQVPNITVARAKERLRIYSSVDDNDLQVLIDTAILTVEKATGRIIRQSTWDLFGDWLPQEIKAFPVRGITGIFYKDTDEVEQTVDAANYYTIECFGGIEINYISGFYPPVMSTRQGRTRVRFTAGYDDGSATGADPNLGLDLRVELAVLFLVGVWYENREPITSEEKFKIPKTFDFITAQLKVYN